MTKLTACSLGGDDLLLPLSETQPENYEDSLCRRRELERELDETGFDQEADAVVQRLQEQYGHKENDVDEAAQLREPDLNDPDMWIIRVSVCTTSLCDAM